MTSNIIYLASPYTHTSPRIRQLRYELAREACAYMLRQSVPVYSPIVHCHDLAQSHNLPHTAAFWKWYNREMLQVSCGLFVLQLPGVEQSVGVQWEVEMAVKLDLEREYISPTEWGLDEQKLSELAASVPGVHSAVGSA